MSLATRCPTCGTAFRVVSDQLKLRRGLVRCGKCRHIFNGFEHLLYISASGEALASVTGEVPAAQPPAPPRGDDFDPDNPQTIIEIIGELSQPIEIVPTPVAAAEPTPVAPPAPVAAPVPEPAPAPIVQQPAPEPVPAPMVAPAPAAARLAARTPAYPALAPVEPETGPDADTDTDAESAIPETASMLTTRSAEPSIEDEALVQRFAPPIPVPPPPAPAPAHPPAHAYAFAPEPDAMDFNTVEGPPTELPAFMLADSDSRRRARRRWRAAGSLLAGVLVLQALFFYRSDVAARMPALRGSLERVCAIFACVVGYPRRIDDVVIVSSELQPIAGSKDALLMTLVLRNRASTELAWPAIELTLTDMSDRPVVRKVFLPSEYIDSTAPDRNSTSVGPPGAALGVNAEPVVRLGVDISGLTPLGKAAAGYRVGIFYP
jgi:predicted Zn finger-like uncharacterized protein